MSVHMPLSDTQAVYPLSGFQAYSADKQKKAMVALHWLWMSSPGSFSDQDMTTTMKKKNKQFTLHTKMIDTPDLEYQIKTL